MTRGDGITGTSQLIVDQSGHLVAGAGEVTIDRPWPAIPSSSTISELRLRRMAADGR